MNFWPAKIWLRYRCRIMTVLGIATCALVAGPLSAANNSGQRNWAGKGDFGGAGLLQTRTARSSADGLLEVGFSNIFPYKRYYLTLQALPWLEGTFRYTDIQNRLFSPFGSFSGTQTFKDRGADISVRLLEESKYFPALAITFQDGLGTGQFSGEYMSATKRFRDLDITGGIVWGYGARSNKFTNPLTYLSSGFSVRSGGATTGGQVNFGDYFTGEKAAVFGGLAYRTPIEGLVFKFEYDPNDYQLEPQSNVLAASSHINYGFSYRPFHWFEASAAIERGNSYMFRFSLLSNLHDPGMPKSDPPPNKLKSRPDVEKDLLIEAAEGERPWWYLPVFDDIGEGLEEYLPKLSKIETENEYSVARMFDGFGRTGMDIQAIETKRTEVKIIVSGEEGFSSTDNFEEIARLVADTLPEQSERITLSNKSGKDSITILRSELEENEIVEYLFEGLEGLGLELKSLSLTHERADIVVSRIRSEAELNVHVAKLVLQSLPTPVEQISLGLANGEHEVQRYSYFRDEIEREALVDELFSSLDRLGITVESIDLSDTTAKLTVAEQGQILKSNYQEIATTIENSAPRNLKEIELVFIREGYERTKTIFRKVATGEHDETSWAASGSSDVSDSAMVPEWSMDDRKFLTDHLFRVLRKEGILAVAIDFNGYRVTVYGGTRKFRQSARNLGRAMREIANNVPSEIEELEFVTMASGMELSRVVIRRKDLELADRNKLSPEEIWANGEVSKPRGGIFYPESAIRSRHRYPSLNWTFKPKLRQHLGGPDQFLLYQLYLTAGFDVDIWRGLGLTGRVNRNIYDNFKKIQFGSDSVLPHVRSDVKEYLQESKKYSINRFQANYYFSPRDEWYVRGSAGIFEGMFGGYSAEILHRPFDSRLAVGVDVNKVWKRSFDRRFTFQDYNVLTGFMSLYYELPWHGVLAKMQLGQYLAGDRGVTFTGSRRFDSGVMVGLWGTFTDVSAEQFGEGSFDKGFYLRIPFELFLTNSTKQTGTFSFRPITRDGGAMLGMQGALHSVTSGGSKGEVMRDWNRFLE
jgi:hypothetical protein